MSKPILPERKRNTLSKRDLIYLLSRHSDVEIKEVRAVLDALELVLTTAVQKDGPGLFTLPGIMKVTTHPVPAVPAGRRKDNWTGEMRDWPARPASVKVRLRPLKKLKDAAL